MSKIEKLAILGVRSFDNTHAEMILLHSPLTLIVGSNGSGKTTIIEALKYATSGIMPPNSRGGAFIHDPKLCGESEVLAQVKLQFRSTSGAKMVVTRNLQLTVKKAARSQKTLEGSLVMLKDAERHAISSRVAELDHLVPQYLGVSTAVLDNVIFCHQDESLWPLSEPSVLKKKFDEVFEALKYTKAIDNLKVLRKKQVEELGKLKTIEEHAKDDKDKASRMEQRFTVLAAEIEALRTKVHDFAEPINSATTKAQEAWDHFASFEAIVKMLDAKRIEAQTKQDSVDDLKQHIKEMADSDDELRTILASHDERLSLHETDLDMQKKHYRDLAQQIDGCRQDLTAKFAENGEHQAHKDAYDRHLVSRETLIKETARKHAIRGFDHDLDHTKIRDFMDRVVRLAREQNTAFDRARQETQQALHSAQVSLDQLNSKKSALNQQRESAKAQISSSERKVDALQHSLDGINMDEGGKATLEANISDLRSRLQHARGAADSAELEARINDMNKQLQEYDTDSVRLNAELAQATKRAGDTARLDFLRKALKDSQRSLETMLGAHRNHITKILGQDWNPDTLESVYQSVSLDKQKHVKGVEQQRDGAGRELELLATQLQTFRKDINAKREECKQAAVRVNEACEDEPDQYPKVLQDLESNRNTIRKDVENFATMGTWYKDCITTANDNDVCRLCTRAFRNERERQQFVSKLEKAMAKAELETLQEDLKSAEEDLATVKAVEEDYQTWKRLSGIEIPHLEAEIQRLEPRHAELLNRVEDADRAVDDAQAVKRDLESVAKTVQNIIKYSGDVTSTEAQISETAAQQSQGGLARSLEDVQAVLTKSNEDARSLRAQLAKFSSDRDLSKSQASSLELELRDAQAKLSTAEHQLKEKSGLAAQLEELRQTNRDHKTLITTIDSQLRDLAPEISQEQARYDEISRHGDERQREIQQTVNETQESLNQLRLAQREIDEYIDRGGEQNLLRTAKDIERLQAAVSKIEEEQRLITIEVKKVEDLVRNHSETRRSVNDNLRYRRDLRALLAVRGEIAEMESQNAEVDRERYKRESQRWETELTRLKGERERLTGQMTSKDETLLQMLEEYDRDYKDSGAKYKEAHIKVEAYKAAVEDLGRYAKALDQAIMQYHSLKMEEINRIIEELWRRTYQGTDVDTIMIRSENETQKGNKSYNYRVCMVKQEIQMDMRGRCSAGQKVLASIIIRLALAECFGQRCGLIALDEPTTNLDRDNIRALAESLNAIIKARRAQSNLQIVVITHDEDFLRDMQAVEFGDYYYRVSRNEHQKSEIWRQEIADILR